MDNSQSGKQQILQGLVGSYLLPMIFEYIKSPDKQGKANLRSLALTRKVFSGPALDRLWRTLEGLDPLLAFVMPPEESVVFNDKPSERLRFDLYRHRVHELNVRYAPKHSPISSSEVGHKYALLMCHFLRREGLLPNLRVLSIHASEGDRIEPLIPFLLTQSLQTLTILGHSLPPFELFSMFASLCPSLECLSVRADCDAWVSDDGIFPLQALSRLKQLRSLTVNTCTWPGKWSIKGSSVERLFSQLPHISNVSLISTDFEHDWSTGGHESFRTTQLESFSLSYYPPLSSMLQQPQILPFITELTLGILPTTTHQELSSFITTIASQSQLSKFATDGVGEYDIQMRIYAEDLDPLFSLPTLRAIILEGVILTHRPVEDASASAPRPVDAILQGLQQQNSTNALENLCLPAEIFPMPTFESLIGFAQKAPWLKELTLGISIASPQMDHLYTQS
ncbi:hypothetical protein BKA70DRAFT_1307758, partial [Coprinopsis sp. MPI-PUGE-AT-0042]